MLGGILAAATTSLRAAVPAVLDTAERATLEAVCDALVPGAAEAGVADFVEAMLADPERVLAYMQLGQAVPARSFYRSALAALDGFSRARFATAVPDLSPERRANLCRALLVDDDQDWNGPPRQLVYWSLRNDALDVCYANVRAYDRLDIPYMAHIDPPRTW